MQATIDARFAREMDLAAAYDEFYAGAAAPLPTGVVAADEAGHMRKVY